MIRIAIACAVLLSLARLWSLSPLVAPTGLYRPVGPWMLLGHARPPAALLDVLWVLAWGATLAMLVGFATRASTAISFGAAVALAAVSFSGSATWSHQYNVVFLAQCAFLGARGGDTLSVDALIRRLRGRPPVDVPAGYQWSLRLVQLAVALMFAGAMFHKLLHGHGTLRWALSDNLRHQLLVRYDLAGLDRTAIARWLVDDVWRYRTAALLNLGTQLLPILACVFVRRPWVRAACGALFVVEVLALGFVMALWNLHWLPLAAVFVDWDALLRRPAPPPRPPPWTPPRAVRIFVPVFVAYEVLTSFIPTLDQRLDTYPFSSFPMFATIRAEPPYDEHRPYTLAGDHLEVLGGPVHRFAQRWLDYAFRGLYKLRDPERVRRRLASILELAPRKYPDATIRGLRAYVALFEAPAYPAPARFERHDLAITGELAPDGAFRSLLGTATRTPAGVVAELRPRGLDASRARVVVYAANRPAPLDVAATRTGDRIELRGAPAGPLYIVAIVDELPWLIASID